MLRIAILLILLMTLTAQGPPGGNTGQRSPPGGNGGEGGPPRPPGGGGGQGGPQYGGRGGPQYGGQYGGQGGGQGGPQYGGQGGGQGDPHFGRRGPVEYGGQYGGQGGGQGGPQYGGQGGGQGGPQYGGQGGGQGDPHFGRRGPVEGRPPPKRRPWGGPSPDEIHWIQWPDHSDLCPEDGGIPKFYGTLPFDISDPEAHAGDIYQWVAAMQMCFFDFVNEEFDYATLVAGEGITAETLVCFDDEICLEMASPEINEDITGLRQFVDIHKQEYKVDWDEFTQYSFRIKGERTVKVEAELNITGITVGASFDNEFEETYTFNQDGTLARRDNHMKGRFAAKLIKAGHAQYVHFAQAVDGIVDDNGNIPIGYGEYTYVIDKRLVFIVILFGLVAILTSISCCMMYKMCKGAKNVVYKGVATDTE